MTCTQGKYSYEFSFSSQVYPKIISEELFKDYLSQREARPLGIKQRLVPGRLAKLEQGTPRQRVG
jgi:hypothetical protein